MSAAALDPVTLALVQNRLDHISHQMGWVMTRTASGWERKALE